MILAKKIVILNNRFYILKIKRNKKLYKLNKLQIIQMKCYQKYKKNHNKLNNKNKLILIYKIILMNLKKYLYKIKKILMKNSLKDINTLNKYKNKRYSLLMYFYIYYSNKMNNCNNKLKTYKIK